MFKITAVNVVISEQGPAVRATASLTNPDSPGTDIFISPVVDVPPLGDIHQALNHLTALIADQVKADLERRVGG